MKRQFSASGWIVALAATVATVAAVSIGRSEAHVGHAASDQDSGRYGEAIVLRGEQLGGLQGRQLEAIIAIDDQGRRLLLQVDERDAAGAFVAVEDGILDANDELVLMAEDAGADWPADGIIPLVSGQRIKVTDPLGTADRWIFVGGDDPARPFGPTHPLPEAAIRYVSASSRIAGRSYAMDFAQPSTDGFIGPKGMRFTEAGPNLVDRLKIRFTVRTFLGADTYTEEDIAANADVRAAEGPPPRIGPLRIVLDAQGQNLALAQRLTISRGTYEDVALPLGATLEDLRMALDLSPAALGATYRDARGPAVLTIDEKPDAPASRPLPLWRELTFAEGRLLLLSRLSSAASSARQTFDDGGKAPANDTGDKRLIGQIGVVADSMPSLGQADFPGELVFLPPGNSLSAERLAAQAAAPLRVEVLDWSPLGPASATPPPTVVSATPTAVEATPTLGAATATATTTATVGTIHGRLWLPWLQRP